MGPANSQHFFAQGQVGPGRNHSTAYLPSPESTTNSQLSFTDSFHTLTFSLHRTFLTPSPRLLCTLKTHTNKSFWSKVLLFFRPYTVELISLWDPPHKTSIKNIYIKKVLKKSKKSSKNTFLKVPTTCLDVHKCVSIPLSLSVCSISSAQFVFFWTQFVCVYARARVYACMCVRIYTSVCRIIAVRYTFMFVYTFIFAVLSCLRLQISSWQSV